MTVFDYTPTHGFTIRTDVLVRVTETRPHSPRYRCLSCSIEIEPMVATVSSPSYMELEHERGECDTHRLEKVAENPVCDSLAAAARRCGMVIDD